MMAGEAVVLKGLELHKEFLQGGVKLPVLRGANIEVKSGERGRLGDVCQRMDARLGARRLVEKRQGAGEIKVRILGYEARDLHSGQRFRHQDRAGLGVLHLGRVLGIGEEG